jgi:hypothetical protein
VIGDWFQCETDGNHCATHSKLGMADPAMRQSQAENLSRSEYASQPRNRCGRIWIAHVRDDSGIPLARIEHSRLCHTREQYPRSRQPLPLGRPRGSLGPTAALCADRKPRRRGRSLRGPAARDPSRWKRVISR